MAPFLALLTCLLPPNRLLQPRDIVSIGITNQRETLIPWDSRTGAPRHNAIVWSDSRTSAICSELASPALGGRDRFRASTGLSVSTYFSAVKLIWLLRHSPAVAAAAAAGTLRVGTVDSWLIYRLTGGGAPLSECNDASLPNDPLPATGTATATTAPAVAAVPGAVRPTGVHVTDVANASRTMLMSLVTRAWCTQICSELAIDPVWLPRICSNSEVLGHVAAGPLAGTPIGGCIGDQQAALLGQFCLSTGDAKNTYGTGCFLLCNTGTGAPVASSRGLLTTVAFQLGPSAPCSYALEGSVASAGSALTWLQTSLGLVASPREIDEQAASVPDNGGVYFVPAFSGLLAPHWREDARAAVFGLTRFATKAHLCRAAVEAAALQTTDVVRAMEADAGIIVRTLKVDGGMTRSPLLCQFQADLLDCAVERPKMDERTALGAAVAAGLAVGVWESAAAAAVAVGEGAGASKVYRPSMEPSVREKHLVQWKKAVSRSVGWEGGAEDLAARL